MFGDIDFAIPTRIFLLNSQWYSIFVLNSPIRTRLYGPSVCPKSIAAR